MALVQIPMCALAEIIPFLFLKNSLFSCVKLISVCATNSLFVF